MTESVTSENSKRTIIVEETPAKSKVNTDEQNVSCGSKEQVELDDAPQLRKNPGMYDLLAHIKRKVNGLEYFSEDDGKLESVIKIQNFDRGDEPTI